MKSIITSIGLILILAPIYAQEIPLEDLKTYTIPIKKSELDGWDGLKVIKGKRCGECCTLIFPDEYGLKSSQQFYRIVNLMRSAPSLEHDTKDCWFPVYEYAANQLLHLAIHKNHEPSASLLISPNAHEFLHLWNKGHFAEEYTRNYYLKVINNYANLDKIININVIHDFISHDCFIHSMVEIGLIEKHEYSKAISKLKEVGNGKFSRTIQWACNKASNKQVN
ncbi:MAG: hypothetical protein OQK82_03090 [Candidatus Pacearchaeota archaeon]|nr:hypothetical protein [Candidatus Pacearchaeota archaeon]